MYLSLCLGECLSVYMKTCVCLCVYVNYVGVWAGFKVCLSLFKFVCVCCVCVCVYRYVLCVCVSKYVDMCLSVYLCP